MRSAVQGPLPLEQRGKKKGPREARAEPGHVIDEADKLPDTPDGYILSRVATLSLTLLASRRSFVYEASISTHTSYAIHWIHQFSVIEKELNLIPDYLRWQSPDFST